MATLSYEGTRAKIQAIDGIREKISRKLIENWYVLHPGGNPPPDSDNVRAEMEERLNPPADASGNVPKYITIGGERVPTVATIEEIGERTGRAAEEGTTALGSGLLGKLWTAIRAFFDWITGGSKSFTEAYAKIATGDINAAFEKQMGDMAQDPEHKKFFEENNFVAEGRKNIAQAVRVKAGLEEAPEAFDLDKVERPKAPKVNVEEIEAKINSAHPNAKPEEKIDGYIAAAIAAVKEQPTFREAIDKLDDKDKAKLAESEKQIMENATRIATGNDAPKNGKAFADRVIKETFKEDLGANADKVSLDERIAELNKGTPEQQKAAALMGALAAQLEAVYPSIQKERAGTVLSAEDKKKLEQEQQQAQAQAKAETGKAQAAAAEKQIVAGVSRSVKDAGTKSIALAAAEKEKEWSKNGWGLWLAFNDAVKAIRKYKDKEPASPAETMEQKSAALTLATVAAERKMAPNQVQLDYMAKAAGETVAEIAKDPNNKSLSDDQLAQHISARITARLEDDRAKIDALGTPIAEIDQNSKISSFGAIADGVAKSIENKEVRNKLAQAQQIFSDAHMAKTMDKAGPVATASVRHDNVPLPASGNFVGAAGMTPGLSPNSSLDRTA